VAANSIRKEDSGCKRWHQKKKGSSSKNPISKTSISKLQSATTLSSRLGKRGEEGPQPKT